MDLIHNQVICISNSTCDGIYRIVLAEPRLESLVIAKIDDEQQEQKANKAKITNAILPRKKKPPLRNVGELIWLDYSYIQELLSQGKVKTIEVVEQGHFSTKLSESNQKLFDQRISAMSDFLDFDVLRDSIIAHKNIGQLVKQTIEKSGLSRAIIYRHWSLLCRFGFTIRSLRPRRDRCGAPGILRPCEPGGRKKPGRKSIKERLYGVEKNLTPEQPGMTNEWRIKIMAADQKIPSPKPSFPSRYLQILKNGFTQKYIQVDGKLMPAELVKGEYPNRGQVRRVLENEIPRLHRLLEKTTVGHFNRNIRGMNGRSWKGVAGPGHTWAIDSTIGDIFLRSSINRAWIIGRPAVYILVDVWSTAIVGFYVCLQSPSWDMVKLALFSSVADADLIADLWGYQTTLTLNPYPTLPSVLLCDRGEYLSKNARATGMKLLDCLSYTPPYRPDLKGLVEVSHRIGKDKQYMWVPGSIDARRKEYELRKKSQNEAVFTLREYVHYLYLIFADYNLTADRSHRVDTHMISAGVFPSPAGLWRWGHEVGIGTRRDFSTEQLICDLLLRSSARVTRQGVMFSGMDYESQITNEMLWTATARNFGSWDIDVFHYSGSVSRIWTPNLDGNNLIELSLSQQARASSDQTLDEVLDSIMYSKVDKTDLVHWNTMKNLETRARADDLILKAKRATKEALSINSGSSPSITESRNFEIQNSKTKETDELLSNKTELYSVEDIDQEYMQMMREVISAANK